MSISAGPIIAPSSNLVFAYDMSNIQKSWIGEPTTNLYDYSFYQSEGGHTGVRTIGDAPDLSTSVVDYHTITTTSSWVIESVRILIWPLTPLAASTTFRVSFWARVTSKSLTTIKSAFYGNSVNNSHLLTTTWQRFSYSSTTHSSFRALEFGSDDGAITFQVAGIQWESKSFATTYTKTSRSSTQALVDLVRGNAITVSNLTYLSTGTFSFNGASRANLTLTSSSSLNQYTRIVWVKPTATSGDMKSAMLNQIGNNSDMAVGIEAGYPSFHQYTKTGTGGTIDGDWTLRGATLTSLNNIYMIGVTVDRSTSTNNISVYLNGVLDGIGSRTLGISASDNVIIGGPATDDYSGSRMWYGDIYSAYQYNRVLSAAEIYQNFNAMRSRFGL